MLDDIGRRVLRRWAFPGHNDNETRLVVGESEKGFVVVVMMESAEPIDREIVGVRWVQRSIKLDAEQWKALLALGQEIVLREKPKEER